MRPVTVLLLIVTVTAGSEGFLLHSSVFGQYVTIATNTITSSQFVTVTTSTTEQVYNQRFDLYGEYEESDGRLRCSMSVYPNFEGVSLLAGDSLRGEVAVSVSAGSYGGVLFAIRKGGAPPAYAYYSTPCVDALSDSEYSATVYPGSPLTFQWTATSSWDYGIVLLNPSHSPVSGWLTIERVTQNHRITEDYTTTIYETLSSSSSPSLEMPQPLQPTTIQSTNNTPELVSALGVIAVCLGAVFLYFRRKEQPKVTKAKKAKAKKVTPSEVIQAEKVEPQTEKATPTKNFCIECGSELPLKSKFCNNCGTKQP